MSLEKRIDELFSVMDSFSNMHNENLPFDLAMLSMMPSSDKEKKYCKQIYDDIALFYDKRVKDIDFLEKKVNHKPDCSRIVINALYGFSLGSVIFPFEKSYLLFTAGIGLLLTASDEFLGNGSYDFEKTFMYSLSGSFIGGYIGDSITMGVGCAIGFAIGLYSGIKKKRLEEKQMASFIGNNHKESINILNAYYDSLKKEFISSIKERYDVKF